MIRDSRCIAVAVVVAALVFVDAGCSRQDFSRPVGGIRQTTVRIPRDTSAGMPGEAEARTEKLAEVLRRWSQQEMPEPKEYVVGPGDEVTISIFALEQPDKTSEIKRTIGRNGKLSLPFISEELDARGKSVRELEQTIAAAYADRVIRNPQVSVQVTGFRSVMVLMTGAVRNPGVYYLETRESSLLEMLAKAGGLTPEAGDEALVVPGGVPVTGSVAADASGEQLQTAARDVLLTATNEMVTVNLRKLIDEGDLSLNVKVSSGAIITVRSVAEQFVYVLGYVQRPGAYPIRGSQLVDALRAVALAGGLSPTARAENSFVVRETRDGQTIMPVNLVRIARGEEPPVYVQPGDTLVVGSSPLARLSEFVRPSIGAGMSYTPVP